MANGARPGLEVCEGAVACLSISLDIVVDVEGVYVVEEGAILQRSGQGTMAAKVTADSKGEGAKFS